MSSIRSARRRQRKPLRCLSLVLALLMILGLSLISEGIQQRRRQE